MADKLKHPWKQVGEDWSLPLPTGFMVIYRYSRKYWGLRFEELSEGRYIDREIGVFISLSFAAEYAVSDSPEALTRESAPGRRSIRRPAPAGSGPSWEGRSASGPA